MHLKDLGLSRTLFPANPLSCSVLATRNTTSSSSAVGINGATQLERLFAADMDDVKVTNEADKDGKCQTEIQNSHGHVAESPKNISDVNLEATGEELVEQGSSLQNEYTTGEVNMEAAITTDDVIRAGGLGATDDISSFLPVAVDSTDFEASLRDARDFEGPQGEISRPGLGWIATMESE